MSEPIIAPLLRRRGTDEYVPADATLADQIAIQHAADRATVTGPRLGLDAARYFASRCGTAATLQAIDVAAGGGYYDVPAEAGVDVAAAAQALGGSELVVDVQTHYVASHCVDHTGTAGVLDFIRMVAPDRFRELDPRTHLSFAEYLRCVFLESETAVALLTAAPGGVEHNILPNAEITGTRDLVDRLAGSGRLLHHAIVHPDDPREFERLPELISQARPSGLKVYTLFGSPGAAPDRPGMGWMLDDEEVGLPFLECARDLGTRIVCAHKGLSAVAPTGSPSDIGPAAARFPEIDFLVYHSGYEVASGEDGEGATPDADEAVALRGTDRLVASLRAAGVGPGSNVYAELGSTWYLLVRRPLEAAHVLGKLLLAVGDDNVLWGTDSIWYGPTQPLIDAFRAFQIPAELCDRHGYPPLTRERKAKILGLNAARVYGIDAKAALESSRTDTLAWVRDALAEATSRGGRLASR